MASEQRSSGPLLNEMTPETISSGLVPTTSPSTSYVPPSRNDWDLLFQPMFDELINPPPSVVNQAPEAIASIVEVIPPGNADSTGSSSSTTVEQDAPSTSNSTTPTETQSLIIPQDVGEDNLDMEVALDETLVPSAQRLRIGRSNFRLPSDIQSKEPTLQVIYDVLRRSPFFWAFLVTTDVTPLFIKKTLCHNLDVSSKHS
nr:hypothetical protein [Tanacetum cinerariifolium]